MGKQKHERHLFECGKELCGGLIQVNETDMITHNEITVKKCTTCKFQYGIKHVFTKLKQLTKGSDTVKIK